MTSPPFRFEGLEHRPRPAGGTMPETVVAAHVAEDALEEVDRAVSEGRKLEFAPPG